MKTTSELDMYLESVTPFVRKVYKKVADIPAGEVKSYSEIARAIGHPGAAQAVGTALSRNTRTDFVPCHRVIRKDGKLGGYREGIDKKKKLLVREGAII